MYTGCTRPITAWQYLEPKSNGKKEIVFKRPLKADTIEIQLPCGQCISCRLKKSRETAIRAVHESMSYSANCFITLTVAPEFIDKVFPGGGLDHRPWQLFLKKLRKRFDGIDYITNPVNGKVENPIRALMCGEYGEIGRRPHYHACLFNFDFPDKYLWNIRDGIKLYRSAALEELWPYGFCTIGEVNFESAAYLARYVVKKVNGDEALEHYLNEDTGEIMKSDYIQFPRGFGLGRLFYEEHKVQIYDNDEVRNFEKSMKPPRYYDKLFESEDFEKMQEVKGKRILTLRKKKEIDAERLEKIESAQRSKMEFFTFRHSKF